MDTSILLKKVIPETAIPLTIIYFGHPEVGYHIIRLWVVVRGLHVTHTAIEYIWTTLFDNTKLHCSRDNNHRV